MLYGEIPCVIKTPDTAKLFSCCFALHNAYLIQDLFCEFACLAPNLSDFRFLPSPPHSLWNTPKCFAQPQITHYKDNKPNLIAFCLWNYVLIYSKCPRSAPVGKICSFSIHVDWVIWAGVSWSEPDPVLIEESNRQPYLIRLYANTGPGCTRTWQEEGKT